MRIVISSGSRTWGGLEAMADALARSLHARGHQVVLFCRRGSPLQRRLEDLIPTEAVLRGDRLHPITLARCTAALRRHPPHVVIGNTMREPGWTGIAARALGIPYLHRHEFNIPYPGGVLDRALFGRIPIRHIVNSRASRETLISETPWLDPGRVVVIPNGIEIARFAQAVPEPLPVPEGAVVFGFVGRWEEAKGVRELTAAWGRVAAAAPDAWLAVAALPGSMALPPELSGVPRVLWLQFQKEIGALMQALDVLVFPSHREGFGLVMVEAMAAGAAVIASDTSAMPEIVRQGVDGILVTPRDPDALAEAMIRLAADPGRRVAMGEAGRVRARSEFSAERMAAEHERLLEQVIGREG